MKREVLLITLILTGILFVFMGWQLKEYHDYQEYFHKSVIEIENNINTVEEEIALKNNKVDALKQEMEERIGEYEKWEEKLDDLQKNLS